MNSCPCCSGKEYEICCEPILFNYSANSAEQLMRSRFSAYVYKNIDYIFYTSTKNIQKSFQKKDIINWISKIKWLKLEIISSSNNSVEFKAYYSEVGKNEIQIHHEKSTFTFEKEKWFYCKGEWIE